jgi:hypothetical protein
VGSEFVFEVGEAYVEVHFDYSWIIYASDSALDECFSKRSLIHLWVNLIHLYTRICLFIVIS